jgi:hypothetical protein
MPMKPVMVKSNSLYHFDKAKVIVSLGADFRNLSPNSVINMPRKKSYRRKPELSKHFQFEQISQ